jgi:hypothetical protein
VSPCDQLGEDRDRDLLLGRRAQVEAGGAADGCQRFLADSSFAKLDRDRGRSLRACDEADVPRFRRQRHLERVLVAAAHRGDDDRVRALERLGRPPSEHVREPAQRSRSWRVTDYRKQRTGQLWLDQDLDRPFRRAATLDALAPDVAVGEGRERQPDDLRLRARAADPAA